MLPDLRREAGLWKLVLGGQPYGNALRSPRQIIRAQTLESGLCEFNTSLLRGQLVDTAVDDPPTLLPDPRLGPGQAEDEIEESRPFGESGVRLEKDGRLDDRLRAKEPSKMMVSLFLDTQQISPRQRNSIRPTCPVSLPAALDCDSKIPKTSEIASSAGFSVDANT
jgi:hypothetical protein